MDVQYYTFVYNIGNYSKIEQCATYNPLIMSGAKNHEGNWGSMGQQKPNIHALNQNRGSIMPQNAMKN